MQQEDGVYWSKGREVVLRVNEGMNDCGIGSPEYVFSPGDLLSLPLHWPHGV
jgi:hypothetical protein